MARNNANADRKGDELDAHRQSEEPLRQTFRLALQQLEKDDPTLFKTFQQHITHAHAAAASEVRHYDIISWFGGLPSYVVDPLNRLRTYYHKEAKLSCRLAEYEGRNRAPSGLPQLWPIQREADKAAEQEYAAKRYGKSHYGFEEHRVDDGPFTFRPRFDGQLQLRHTDISLTLRLVRLDRAAITERFGHMPQNAKALDRKVLLWLEDAMKYITNAIDTGKLPSAPNSIEQAATAHTLTAAELILANAVSSKLKAAYKDLTQRCKLIMDLIKLREQHSKALEEAEKGRTDPNIDLQSADAEAKSLALTVADVEEKLDKACGGRVRWEWVGVQGAVRGGVGGRVIDENKENEDGE